jgi:hypothetical protein
MAETNPPELCLTITFPSNLSIEKGNLFEIINNLLIILLSPLTIVQKLDHENYFYIRAWCEFIRGFLE